MPYVTSIERLGRCDGIRLGIELLSEARSGEAGIQWMPEIRAIYDEAQLLAIHKALVTANSLDVVRRLWSPQS